MGLTSQHLHPILSHKPTFLLQLCSPHLTPSLPPLPHNFPYSLSTPIHLSIGRHIPLQSQFTPNSWSALHFTLSETLTPPTTLLLIITMYILHLTSPYCTKLYLYPNFTHTHSDSLHPPNPCLTCPSLTMPAYSIPYSFHHYYDHLPQHP